MGTPYRISCLRQQPSGIDRRCQIWPIRGYTRFWYTGMASCEINFNKPMPPTLGRRQRQRNMNPRSGQSKQESYVIMLTEIGFS